ncbi:MAG: hypothetical protein RIC14_12635 [Filomicrobium sp.]
MTDHTDYVAKAKQQIEKLGNELDELEQRAKAESRKASEWYTQQMTKLRGEWQEASSRLEELSNSAHAEAKTTYQHVRADTERHWKALEAAVKAYRDRIDAEAA